MIKPLVSIILSKNLTKLENNKSKSWWLWHYEARCITYRHAKVLILHGRRRREGDTFVLCIDFVIYGVRLLVGGRHVRSMNLSVVVNNGFGKTLELFKNQ